MSLKHHVSIWLNVNNLLSFKEPHSITTAILYADYSYRVKNTFYMYPLLFVEANFVIPLYKPVWNASLIIKKFCVCVCVYCSSLPHTPRHMPANHFFLTLHLLYALTKPQDWQLTQTLKWYPCKKTNNLTKLEWQKWSLSPAISTYRNLKTI